VENDMKDFTPEMTESDPNKIAFRLIQKAHNRDGLPEITAGVSLLWVVALIYASNVYPPGSLAAKLATLAFALLTPLMCIGLPWAIKGLRRRFLIARTGYVKSRPLALRPKFLSILIAILVAAAVATLVVHTRWQHTH
jgi:hypothetical protein